VESLGCPRDERAAVLPYSSDTGNGRFLPLSCFPSLRAVVENFPTVLELLQIREFNNDCLVLFVPPCSLHVQLQPALGDLWSWVSGGEKNSDLASAIRAANVPMNE
jgi:hypothetical protein